MKLSSYIDKSLVFVDLPGETKYDLIASMVEKIGQADKTFLKNKVKISQLIVERENSMSTMIGNGIFVPHARTDFYDDIVVAVGIPSSQVEEELPTGEKEVIKVIFLVVTQKTNNKLMLNLLAGVSSIGQDEAFLSSLKKAATSDKLYHSLVKYDPKIKDGILAKDIMVSMDPANLNDNLQQLVSKLVSEGVAALPVVDENGVFAGEVTERELIEAGIPKEAKAMRSLGFLRSSDPFDEFFKNESTIQVKDIYRKKAVFIDRKAPIMEVAFVMLKRKITRMYVVEDGQYYGSISRGDIIKKVLHL